MSGTEPGTVQRAGTQVGAAISRAVAGVGQHPQGISPFVRLCIIGPVDTGAEAAFESEGIVGATGFEIHPANAAPLGPNQGEARGASYFSVRIPPGNRGLFRRIIPGSE